MKSKLLIPIPENSKLVLEINKEYPPHTKVFDINFKQTPILIDVSHILNITIVLSGLTLPSNVGISICAESLNIGFYRNNSYQIYFGN